MIRKLVPLLVLVALAGACALTGTALALPCDPDKDPGCDPGGGETSATVMADLDVAPPAQGTVTGSQISCGSDCHGDFSYTRVCADFDCHAEDIIAVPLDATGGRSGFSPHFTYCPANTAGNACVGPVTDCGIGRCVIGMDDDYRATLAWADTTAPAAAFSSPPTRVGPSRLTFTAVGTDNSGDNAENAGISEVRFFIDDAVTPAATDTSAPFQFDLPVGDFAEGQLVNLKARAVDGSGNVGDPASADFVVDRHAGAAVGAVPGHFQTPPAIAFTRDADVAAGDVSCHTLAPGGAEVDSLSPCSSPYVPELPGGSPDGTYTVRVDVADDVGNTGSGSTTFVRDDSDPNVSIVSPADGSRVRAPFTPQVDASDGLTAPGNLAVTCRLDAGAPGSCDAALSPPDGQRTLIVRAVDEAGNERTVTSTFTVDTTGPQVAFTQGPADGAIVGTAAVSFKWTATDGSLPIEQRCKLDAGALGACSGNGTHALKALGEGTHTFLLRVTDGLGNVREVERDFFVNAVRPKIAITGGPADGDVVKSRDVTFAFAASGGTVSCSLDSETAFGPCGSGSGQALRGLTEGAHTFRVRVIDESGDAVVASRTFRVDISVPPTIVTSVTEILKSIINPSLSAGSDAFKRYTIFRRLTLKGVPAGAKVTVLCKGKKCPARRFASTKQGAIRLKKFTRKKLRVGTRLTIRVTKDGSIGKQFVITIRRGKSPRLKITPIA